MVEGEPEQGYGEGEYDKDVMINTLVEEVRVAKTKVQELQGVASTSALGYTAQKDSNLIALQLNTPELLGSLERFYRGEKIVVDDDGNISYKPQEDDSLIPLNEFGVNLLMEIVTKYIDKNTVLSNYKEERIYEILADIGEETTLVVFCNYEKMGMDTAYKKSKFRIIVVTTLHIIESAYRRALDGKTSEDLNQSRIVTQSDSLGRPLVPNIQHQKRGFLELFNPKRYGA